MPRDCRQELITGIIVFRLGIFRGRKRPEAHWAKCLRRQIRWLKQHLLSSLDAEKNDKRDITDTSDGRSISTTMYTAMNPRSIEARARKPTDVFLTQYRVIDVPDAGQRYPTCLENL